MTAAELGQTQDPKALIPGNPEAIVDKARHLGIRSEDAIGAGEALKRIDTGTWTGEASGRFHEAHQTDLPRWQNAGDSLDIARQALEDFADCLFWAQGQAGEAIHLWNEGQSATQQAHAAHEQAVAQAQARTQSNASQGNPAVVAPPVFSDPGEAKRQAARDLLQRARQQLGEVGDRTAEALRAEAALVPQDSQKQADANFYGGIWSSVEGLGDSLAGVFTDPAGTVAAMAHNITHPVQTFKDAVAWDDWANGRGDRALGKVTGEVMLSAATFGVGKVAKTLLKRPDHDGDGPEGDTTPDKAEEPPPRREYEPTRNRVKLREGTKREIIDDAPRTPDGDFICESSGKIIPAERGPDGNQIKIDPDTGKPDPNGMTIPEKGTYDFGHREGHEWWRYKQEAEAGGYTREKVIEDQNDPSKYQVEERSANRSHRYEQPR